MPLQLQGCQACWEGRALYTRLNAVCTAHMLPPVTPCGVPGRRSVLANTRTSGREQTGHAMASAPPGTCTWCLHLDWTSRGLLQVGTDTWPGCMHLSAGPPCAREPQDLGKECPGERAAAACGALERDCVCQQSWGTDLWGASVGTSKCLDRTEWDGRDC